MSTFHVELRTFMTALDARFEAMKPKLWPSQQQLCVARIRKIDRFLSRFSQFNPNPNQQQQALAILKTKGVSLLCGNEKLNLNGIDFFDESDVEQYLAAYKVAEYTITNQIPYEDYTLVQSWDTNRNCVVYSTEQCYSQEMVDCLFPKLLPSDIYKFNQLFNSMPLLNREKVLDVSPRSSRNRNNSMVFASGSSIVPADDTDSSSSSGSSCNSSIDLTPATPDLSSDSDSSNSNVSSPNSSVDLTHVKSVSFSNIETQSANDVIEAS